DPKCGSDRQDVRKKTWSFQPKLSHMSHLPRAIHTAAQVRELERYAIETLGISGYTLMSRAGAAAFATLKQAWPEARTLLVVCGPGNNGGDGYVLARLARAARLRVTTTTI